MTTLLAMVLVGGAAAYFVGSPSGIRIARIRTVIVGPARPRSLASRVNDALASGPTSVLQRLRRKARRADRSDAISEACVIMAAELAAGRPPPLALHAAAQEWPELFTLPAGHARIGQSAGPALRQAATTPGAESLVAVAAAWEVSERTGARLADTLLSVADCLRDEAAIRREVQAQLSTVRVTARLMAVLPLGTLGLFSLGNGGEPLAFLVTTPYGLGCLAAATTFISLGIAWVERTSRKATRSAWSS